MVPGSSLDNLPFPACFGGDLWEMKMPVNLLNKIWLADSKATVLQHLHCPQELGCAETLENAALLVRFGLPSTLIRQETGGALRFRVERKHFRSCSRASDISELATFPFQIQKFPHPHVAYSNRIRLSSRIR